MFNVKNLVILIISSLVAGFFATFIATMTGTGLAPYAPYIAAFVSALLLLTAMSFLPSTSASGKPAVKDIRKKDSNREVGVVKWFDSNKGYGFITRAVGEDIFVHFRSIRGKGHRSLYEGQNVEFSVADSDKGPQAEDIAILK